MAHTSPWQARYFRDAGYELDDENGRSSRNPASATSHSHTAGIARNEHSDDEAAHADDEVTNNDNQTPEDVTAAIDTEAWLEGPAPTLPPRIAHMLWADLHALSASFTDASSTNAAAAATVPAVSSSSSLHMLLSYLHAVSTSARAAAVAASSTSATSTSSSLIQPTASPAEMRLRWAACIEGAGSQAERALIAAKEAAAVKAAADAAEALAAATAVRPSARLPPEHPLSSTFAGRAHVWSLLQAAHFLGIDDLGMLLCVRPVALYIEELQQWKHDQSTSADAVSNAAALAEMRASIPWSDLSSPLFLRLLGVLCTFSHSVPPLLESLAAAPKVADPPAGTARGFSFGDDEEDTPLAPTAFSVFCTADVLFDQLLHSDALWHRCMTESETSAGTLDERSVFLVLVRHLYSTTLYHRQRHQAHLISSLRYDIGATPTYPPLLAEVDSEDARGGTLFDTNWNIVREAMECARQLLRDEKCVETRTTATQEATSAETSAPTSCPEPSAGASLVAMLRSTPLAVFHLFGCARLLDPLLIDLLRSSSHRGCALRELNLHGCWQLRPDTLCAVLRAAPNVRDLNLSFCASALKMTSSSVSAQTSGQSAMHLIGSLRDLRTLDVTSCDLEDSQLLALVDAWTTRGDEDRAAAATGPASPPDADAATVSLSSVALGSAAAVSATSASARIATARSAAAASPPFTPALSALNLANNSRVTNASLAAFHRAGLKLDDLCVYGDYRIDDKGLLELSYTRLRRLNTCGCYRVTDGLKRYYFSANPSMLLYNTPQQFGAAAAAASSVSGVQAQRTAQTSDGDAEVATVEHMTVLRCAHSSRR